jgi:hypothetical protein
VPRPGNPPTALTDPPAAPRDPATVGSAPADRRGDPIAEAAVRAKERLRRQREIAVAGLESIAAEDRADSFDAEPLPAEPRLTPLEALEPRAVPPPPPPPLPTSAGDGEIAELQREVEALRRDLQEAVAEMSRDIERAERVAADRARKEARKQGRKSERAARRAARAAVDTPDAPS